MAKARFERMVNDPFTTTGVGDPLPEEALAIAHAPGDWLAAALSLDRRLDAVANRPGDATLTRLRLAWWSEAVTSLSAGPAPVDPDLIRLRPLLAARPDRLRLIEQLIECWDAQVGERATAEAARLAHARATLLLDGVSDPSAEEAMIGRALSSVDPDLARAGLRDGLAMGWPRALRGHRLLARAALHRLEGGSERRLALKLVGWALTGR